MVILPALRWRKWGCGRPYRKAFFVPEQLCRNAAPAQPFLCRITLFPFATQKNVPAHFFVFDKKGPNSVCERTGEFAHRPQLGSTLGIAIKGATSFSSPKGKVGKVGKVRSFLSAYNA
jgi:hypothetical protein